MRSASVSFTDVPKVPPFGIEDGDIRGNSFVGAAVTIEDSFMFSGNLNSFGCCAHLVAQIRPDLLDLLVVVE